MSQQKFDFGNNAFFYAMYVGPSLLKAFRCVEHVISEDRRPDSTVEYKRSGPTGSIIWSRKNGKESMVQKFLTDETKPCGNLPIATWDLTGLNEKTAFYYEKDAKQYAITLFKIPE